MQRKELLKLIEEGEGLKTEFKQRFSTHEKIAKEMIAFANTRGGYIIFGVDDDQSIYGVESEKGEAELIREAAEKYCEPVVEYVIEYFEIEGKEVVVVEVKESLNKPHRIQDYRDKLNLRVAIVYIRVNDKSVIASREIIKLMQTRSNKQKLKNYSIGKNEKAVFEYLNESDFITVQQLSKLANVSYRRASRTLINLVRANLLFVHTKDNGENYFTMI
jgi:predicted HTH transcriptional regulator